jgi:hypothetical protein
VKNPATWIDEMLDELGLAGEAGLDAASYLRTHGIHVRMRAQSAGARWTPCKMIELHPRYLQGPPDAPYALSLVVHEVQHLRQGVVKALSVQGELEAWQAQFRFLAGLLGGFASVPGMNLQIQDLMGLSLEWDRDVLRRARALMRAYAGPRYRVDLMPLYPLHHEFLHFLGRRAPD